MRVAGVDRMLLGTFNRPEGETHRPRVEAVYCYLAHHDRGLVPFDTGFGEGGPRSTKGNGRIGSFRRALGGRGVSSEQIDLVVNCHLHLDHCGCTTPDGTSCGVPAHRAGGPETGRLHTAAPDRVPGSRYELLDGGAEIWPGVHVIRTPGHVAGHQSLVLETDDGTIVLADQSHDTASSWSADVLAVGARLRAMPTHYPQRRHG